MIVDEGSFRLRDGFLDGVELLRHVEAGLAVLVMETTLRKWPSARRSRLTISGWEEWRCSVMRQLLSPW